jgi:hypothetical protein
MQKLPGHRVVVDHHDLEPIGHEALDGREFLLLGLVLVNGL